MTQKKRSQRRRWGSSKPRSRDHEKVQRAAREQKRREGETPNGATLKGAGRRAARRATTAGKMERLQDTLRSADVSAQKHLVNWQNPGIPVAELEDVYDPAHAQQIATHTASLRDDADVHKFAARAEESSAGAAANAASAKAGAARRRKDGFSATYPDRGGRRKRVMTGEQVQEKERRDRAVKLRPPEKRPTFKTQTLAPGSGLIEKKAAGRGRVVKRQRLHPEYVRTQAEISAEAKHVSLIDGGRYQFTIPSGVRDWVLYNLGFRPRRKPTRYFTFKGPTAKADAEAFAKTMMKWLKDPNRVGPPPQPRKP